MEEIEKPNNWSRGLVNAMILNIFVFGGWSFFREKYEDDIFEEFGNKIINGTLQEEEQEKLSLYIPKVFLPFLFAQLKKKQDQSGILETLTSAEMENAWNTYVQFLGLVQQGKIKSENEDGTIETITLKDVVERSKSRLQQFQREFGYYDTATIEYFCYLTQDIIVSMN